jgi:hypothetical protein
MKVRLILSLWAIMGAVMFNSLPAQTDEQNLEKYWRYKKRLNDFFLKVGPSAGESIPAEKIQVNETINHHQGVTWAQSDGTIHLGWYIAVLATENALLRRNGYLTHRNVEELYYALNALWRLDAQSPYYLYADSNYAGCKLPSYCWPACTTLAIGAPLGPMAANNYDDNNILDGFAIRSDAPLGFHHHFESALIQTYGATAYNGGNTTSDLLAPISRNCRMKEMSQDQAIYLLFGLMAVKHFIDPALVYNGVPLRRFAIREGERIVTQLRTHFGTLYNPTIGMEVCRGSNGFSWDYPKAKMGEAINGIPFSFRSDTIVSTFWGAQSNPANLGGHKTNPDMNRAMAAAMVSIGNSWGSPGFHLGNYAKEKWHREIYYLYHHLIHGSPLYNVFANATVYKNLLNTAPCEGPHSTWPNIAPFYGWTTKSRFHGGIHDDDGYDKFTTGPKNSGNANGNDMYNGLDYMLLYILYYLAYDKSQYDPSGIWSNILNMNMANPWPLAPLNFGSNTFPVTKHAVESIHSSSQIKSQSPNGNYPPNGNVTYRAGSWIELTPGFDVQFGAKFVGEIKPYGCPQ